MTLTEIEQSRVDSYNAIEGEQSDTACPLCKGKGHVAVLRNGVFSLRECECEVKKRTLRRIERSGLSDMVRRYTFDNFQTPDSWQVTVKKKAEKYLITKGVWFYICGTPGTGKTHICTAICSELMQGGHEVRYMLWRDDAPRLKAIVNEREDYERELNALKRVDVLYIDDLFKGTVSEADKNLAFEILNARYNSQAVTLISSERTAEDILNLDEAIGSRIIERSRGFCIRCPQKNWRLRQ